MLAMLQALPMYYTGISLLRTHNRRVILSLYEENKDILYLQHLINLGV